MADQWNPRREKHRGFFLRMGKISLTMAAISTIIFKAMNIFALKTFI